MKPAPASGVNTNVSLLTTVTETGSDAGLGWISLVAADEGIPITPSLFKSCWKTVSSDSNAGLVPDTGVPLSVRWLPPLSVVQTVYWLVLAFFQATSYPLAV